MPKTQTKTFSFNDRDQLECLTCRHQWIETSHARPTFCNICHQLLSGVKNRGFSCEVCKFKVHKKCVNKTINNCKWTTLSTIGNEIIEDNDGNILMPHQWIEGNLPVYAKCFLCEKNCGSVLKLQDYRCLWCNITAHEICRHLHTKTCPLGPASLSVVPPIALHSVQDEAWDVFKPQSMSPLLVFVNSKSGDNQGIKFLRKFKQLLNPAQVFDLIAGGPRLGLKLFRHFDMFRILICSGDGSVSWVLSEIDKLDMHKQCQIAILPLGTGNDLARVLGWGSSCDDDACLPTLLEKYEKSRTKMLDRWSIMTFEKVLIEKSQHPFYEFPENENFENTSIPYDTSKMFIYVKECLNIVKTLISQFIQTSHMHGDLQLNTKCYQVEEKLNEMMDELCLNEADFLTVNTNCNMEKSVEKNSMKMKKIVFNLVEFVEKSFDERNFNQKVNSDNHNFEKSMSNTSFTCFHSIDERLIDIEENSDSKYENIDNLENSVASDMSLIDDNDKICDYFSEYFSHIDSTESDNMIINDLNQNDKTKNAKNEDFETMANVCVVIEPPSPLKNEQFRFDESKDHLSSAVDLLSITTDNSSNESLNNMKSHRKHNKKSAATRRVSCCSPVKSTDINQINLKLKKNEMLNEEEKTSIKTENKIPIINPYVLIPSWPNVNKKGGFVGQCLLANADTLCAAVSPLLDPDEAIMEGFVERCVMNNYFGIGIDAKIALDFHQRREENPAKCRSRTKNLLWYGVLGSKEWIHKTYKNLEKKIQLECDGQRIPLPSLQGIVVLNIPSFMGGARFWGKTKEDDIFIEPSYDDKILEVVAVFGSAQMAASRVINLQHHRIAQCHSVQINILNDEGVPIQVDGEAWIQPPGSIRIIHKNRMQMLCRDKGFENCLKSWNEKLKQNIVHEKAHNMAATTNTPISHESKSRFSVPRHSITGNDKILLGRLGEQMRQQSFSEQGLLLPQQIMKLNTLRKMDINDSAASLIFNDDEYELLYQFIERNDLYMMATKADQCLELIHPRGKLIDGANLRQEFTKLVRFAQQLYAETMSALNDKKSELKVCNNLKQNLSTALVNMEQELKNCKFADSRYGSIAYLHSNQDNSKRRRNSFWIKLNLLSFENKIQREVTNWSTDEVATWLDTLDLSEYKDAFMTHDIRGEELVHLTSKDFKEIGVLKIGHIKRLINAIKNL